MSETLNDTARRGFPARGLRWVLNWRRMRNALVALACGATFVAAIYTEENWRGRRAWAECKRELAAKGEMVDWAAYAPVPVPDAENILKAPKMAEWFGGGRGTNELLARLNLPPFAEFVNRRRSNAVAEVTVVTAIGPDELKNADLVLHYNCQVLSLVDTNETGAKSLGSPSPILPLIQFEDVPLTTAIENLARQEGLNYILDPKVGYGQPDEQGQIRTQPNISFRWENLTARRALFALLDTYGLIWIEDAQLGIGRITLKDPADGTVRIEPEARARLLALTRNAIRPRLEAVPELRAKGAQLYTFVAGTLPDAKPLQVMVLAECPLDLKTVADFFPRELGPGFANAGFGWRAESAGSNSFRVFRDREPAYAAADYLAWSDRFQPDFDLLRAALKRPQMSQASQGGDAQRPFSQPAPNYVCIRVLAQAFAQRAQCHLLLGQPAAALQELTLINELRRLLSGKPVTLVAAMIDVAVTGLYVETLTDGLRLQAWREPELVALQQQLGEIELLPRVQAGFRRERAAMCQTLQVIPANEFAEIFEMRWYDKPNSSWWQQHTDPAYLLLKFAPRGWVFQNLVAIARAEQFTVAIIEADQRLVAPAKAAAALREVERLANHPSPYTLLASRAVPHFLRAASILAQNQTKADQALVACGLERCHRLRGAYPETLAALVPQFIAKIPHDLINGQPLKYRRTDDGSFLLYSVGWNEKDDGGTVVESKDGTSAPGDLGDWVWRSAAK